MPLYEYECGRCGKRFELIQKFSDPPQATCAECGGAAHRLLSAPAIQFKGSGWYVTDYARKSAPAEKTEGKTDDKPPANKEEAPSTAPSSKNSD
jgi:putative FmdB family regulatory protein